MMSPNVVVLVTHEQRQIDVQLHPAENPRSRARLTVANGLHSPFYGAVGEDTNDLQLRGRILIRKPLLFFRMPQIIG